MSKRITQPVRIAGIVFVLALAIIVFQPPPAPVQGAQAQPPGKEALQKLCATCHALERVTASRRSRAQWEESIDKMVTLGAKGTDEEFTAVLGYLLRQYGRVNVNTGTVDEITEVLGLSVQAADVIVKYRREKGKFADFEALSKVPDIEVEKLEKRRDAISF